MTAIEMIAAERRRQVEEEGFDVSHDDAHDEGELAAAAACFAAPTLIYGRREHDGSVEFYNMFPDGWGRRWDKRRDPGGALEEPQYFGDPRRLRLLTIAGALIVAEMERITRAGELSES